MGNQCPDGAGHARSQCVVDLAQLTDWRDVLIAARYRGIRTVKRDGKRITPLIAADLLPEIEAGDSAQTE